MTVRRNGSPRLTVTIGSKEIVHYLIQRGPKREAEHMASIGVDFFAGPQITLSEAEVQKLVAAGKNINTISTSLTGILGNVSVAGVPVGLVIKVLSIYFVLETDFVAWVDKGNGVKLTLPWAAIWLEQYWLIIPIPVGPAPQDTGLVTVRRSNGVLFLNNESWTSNPYYGTRGTFFADVTGDGKADAIVVNDYTVTVRRSTGSGFGPNEDWTHSPYYGSRGTYFADVDGDGKADAIVVNDNTVTVRRSTGSGFGPNEDWTHGPYYGSRGTYFADVDGDGKADAIVVNDNTVTVRRSTGSGFGPNEDWTRGPYYGNAGTYFTDVDGDRRAEAIAVNK
jgi:hypothetical protein